MEFQNDPFDGLETQWAIVKAAGIFLVLIAVFIAMGIYFGYLIWGTTTC